jgi:hypothetical protein
MSITWKVCNTLPLSKYSPLIDSVSMKRVLVHSNIIPDVFTDGLKWDGWAESKLEECGGHTS